MSSSSIFQTSSIMIKKGVANFRVKPRPQIRPPHCPSHQKPCPFIIKKGGTNFWVKPRLNETTTSSIIKKGVANFRVKPRPNETTSLPRPSHQKPHLPITYTCVANFRVKSRPNETTSSLPRPPITLKGVANFRV